MARTADQLTNGEVLDVQELNLLADSAANEYIAKVGGAFVNKADTSTGANTALSNLVSTAVNTDLKFGVGNGATYTFGTKDATTAATGGDNLVISAGDGLGVAPGGTIAIIGGDGGSTTTGGAGAGILIQGGDAKGSGANDGGNVELVPGTKTGAGANGVVYIQDPTSNLQASFNTASLASANKSYTFPNRSITFDNITTSTTTNGTGFLKGNGTVVSFDNSAYINTTQNALTKEPTGFSVQPTINYDPTTQKITLIGAFVAYYQGVDVSVANPTFVNGWVSTAHTNTADHNYFLSYDGANFVWTTDAFSGFDQVLIASVYYGTANKYALRESHGFMPWQDHQEFHETIGTYKSSGGTIPAASYALSSTTAADRRPNIDQTIIQDEDLATTLPALTSETYTIYNLTGTSVGAYTLDATDIIPLSTNNPYYNTFSTPNWGQTLMPANSAATVWIYALPVTTSANSQAYRYLFIQPQWITQATNASAGAITTAVNTEALRLPSELNLGTLTTQAPELICIGKIIIDFTTNWTLRAVTLLTGNKFSQIGSPSGNYLSTVATDATLTGTGTGASPLVVANPVAPQTTGFTITAGTTPKVLTVADTASVTGTNTGDNSANSNIGLVHTAGAETITGAKTFDKDTIITKGTSTGTTTLSNANTSSSNYTAILQAKDGTLALTSDISAGGGDMLLGTVQTVTAEKKFDKDKISMIGTSTGRNIISVANTSATDYTNILPAKDGTVAMTTDIVSQVEDSIVDGHTTIAPSGNAVFDALALKAPLISPSFTTPALGTPTAGVLSSCSGYPAASTSVAGLAPIATAPASGLYNYVGITNGETAYTNKALFDATVPSTQAFGDAAALGTSAFATRQDHKHAMMAAPTSVSGNAGTVTTAAETADTSCSIAFVTDVSGSLPLKTNTNLTFNASTGVLTSASAVLTIADINGGTADAVTIGGATAAAGTFTTAKADHIGETTGAHTIVFDNTITNAGQSDLTTIHSTTTLADHIGEHTGSHTIVADNTITAATGAGIILPAGGGVKLTLPTTNAQCTGNYTDSFNAGYSSAVGDLVFFGTGGKWLEVDADAIATCVGLMGIALEAKNDGEAMKVALPGSFVHIDAWNMTVGAVQYAGETLGAIQEAIPTGADAVIRVVGFGLDADTLAFFPSSDSQTTVA